MSEKQSAGRQRAIIESVTPRVDGGRFPVKRSVGDLVTVEADAFVDGHDAVRCLLLWRKSGDSPWHEVDMAALGNDRWRGSFEVTALGIYEYTITAWADAFETWRHDMARWEKPEDVAVALQVGAQLVEATAARARGKDAGRLKAWSESFSVGSDPLARRALALDSSLTTLASSYADRSLATLLEPPLAVTVEPRLARFSSWYEMFPRSAGSGGRHGTFGDCEAMLPAIKALGFDVLYFPPIHPIGETRRKGPNNVLIAGPDDPGSPWAIGSTEGGHKDIHAQLGTLREFRGLVKAARSTGIEIALDIALQCSPDHPYVKQHPEWFKHRPDGSVQFAENPPKKYEDIYPFKFETEQWQSLWLELLSIFLYWIDQGVHVFRVDNPHTKPFMMWEWLIGEVKRKHPEVIFLAEAFTRPRIMHRLAKLGYSQSYTYFAWRNTKAELTEYFTELSQDPSRDYFRPNAWPNTPDILTEDLQTGGRAAFISRLVLAGTLSSNYGIYGPAFELLEHVPRGKGEEYLDSEKYQIRDWPRERADSLAPLIQRVNAARHAHAALQSDWDLHFMATDNEQVICYAKVTPTLSDVVVCVVNLDPRYVQSAWLTLDLEVLGLDASRPFKVQDLLTDAVYEWNGARNFVRLDPFGVPAHILHVRRASTLNA